MLTGLLLFLALIVFGTYSENLMDYGGAMGASRLAPVSPRPDITPRPNATKPPSAIAENGITMRMAVAGDIVAHTGLNAEALRSDGSYDFTDVFSGAIPYLRAADFALADLETTFAGGEVFTGHPDFKSPDGLAESLSRFGIDMLVTANNHAMDAMRDGMIRTLNTIEREGMLHAGTYRTQSERNASQGVRVVNVNNIKLAFVSLTYGLNGRSIIGSPYITNLYASDYTDLSEKIDYKFVQDYMKAARDTESDLIVVTVHWGEEYEREPNEIQLELADLFFAEGADIILGGHTHVPQPIELRDIIDNEGNEKKGLVLFSLGNFVSTQNDPYTELTAIVNIDIEKNLDTGETYILDFDYVPMYMVDLEDHGITNAAWRHRLWDLHAAIDSYKNGDNLGVITPQFYETLQRCLLNLQTVLGPEYDYRAKLAAASSSSDPVITPLVLE